MARRQLHDQYFKKAKAEGYLARSAYKLQEINERKGLFGPGARVLDLGCAPGAWIQIAEEIVGPRGWIVGIDLKEIRESFGPNVTVLQGDVYKTEPAALTGPAGGMFDAVLSDMAPDTSGHGDHFLSVRLCRRVLELLPSVLRPRGNLVMKVFEGEQYQELLRETGAVFREAKGFKPKASRDMSREMYVVGKGYRGAGTEARGHGGTE
jgi:23S rRNA (uridine2552-2'-O)-methyltransferase